MGRSKINSSDPTWRLQSQEIDEELDIYSRGGPDQIPDWLEEVWRWKRIKVQVVFASTSPQSSHLTSTYIDSLAHDTCMILRSCMRSTARIWGQHPTTRLCQRRGTQGEDPRLSKGPWWRVEGSVGQSWGLWGTPGWLPPQVPRVEDLEVEEVE